MNTIGIIGNGFVGSAVISGFSLHTKQIKIYDVDPQRSTHTFDETIKKSDFVFVSVPTPMTGGLGGKIDLSILESVFEKINNTRGSSNPIFILKSTVVPGTVERLIKEYPKLKIVFSPEFLTERSARLDFINSSRIILGGSKANCNKVESLFRSRFPHTKIIKTDPATAQFIKYMANCFFAVKVSFMNEMRQGADILGCDWNDVMNGFVSDGRIGNSHIDVPGHDGDKGYGGKCFPKDINAFISLFEDIGVNPDVMKASWKKNLEVRDNHDWLKIKGATSDNSDFLNEELKIEE